MLRFRIIGASRVLEFLGHGLFPDGSVEVLLIRD